MPRMVNPDVQGAKIWKLQISTKMQQDSYIDTVIKNRRGLMYHHMSVNVVGF